MSSLVLEFFKFTERMLHYQEKSSRFFEESSEFYRGIRYCHTINVNLNHYIMLLYEKRSDIVSYLNETERNRYISKLTGLNAEPGFVSGSTERDLLVIINQRVEMLTETFKSAKKQECLARFYKEGFSGDSCFNGRIISLTKFASKLAGLNYETENLFFKDAANKFAELMYGLSQEAPLSQEELTSYLQSLTDYDLCYKEIVESVDYLEIYDLARMKFLEAIE